MTDTNAPQVIVDAKGRKITIRTINVLDQVKLLRAIGPTQAENRPYGMMVNFAASVSAIDGVPLPFPTNERQIDYSIERLGDEGFAAIQNNIQEKIEAVHKAAEEAGNSEASDEATNPLQPSAI